MNYLFDVAPDEVPDSAKKKPRGKSNAAKAEEKPAESTFAPNIRRRNDTIIGRSEDHYECADTRCQSSQFDILDEWRGEWVIECMLCGTGQKVPAVPGVLKTPDEASDFVFADGRYEGMSMADVAADDKGPVYIAWAAANHKREAVRVACKKWIDSKRAPR